MPHSNSLYYEFGSFRLDVEQRVLTHDDGAVSLPPKATEILLVLLRNAGQLVEKEELMNEVWPNTFVEEANLPQNIFTLRRALGDERASPRYIETVPRRGYRFVEPVKKVNYADHETAELNSDKRKRYANGVLLSSPPTLAVLPFINATGDQSVEYLADGITDNITNNLSRISKLRVMSRSAVFRLSGKDLDPKEMGQLLGVDALLVGKIYSGPCGLAIKAELVEATNGWQLWGESFDCQLDDILEVQDEIVRRLSATLQLKLTGDEERRITTRYTENPAAYQAYLEGRYHWSTYTREGIEKAIASFYHAIELDANYALAYSGIVDCYLRLATNYLPPEGELSEGEKRLSLRHTEGAPLDELTSNHKIRIRYEWDWKGAERELRRANDLGLDYPNAHQWHAAYLFARGLLHHQSRDAEEQLWPKKSLSELAALNAKLPSQIASADLTPGEQVQVFCTIAREQIDAGNYAAACAVLRTWWQLGGWPKLDGLSLLSRADLLFTTGELAGCVASTRQIPNGQKHGEALLNGSIALFEHFGSRMRAAEGRIELALCYYRQGMFDLGRFTLINALQTLSDEDCELKGLALVRLACLERHAGRLHDALAKLREAQEFAEISGSWISGRWNLELASTYKDLASSDGELSHYSSDALEQYQRALFKFEATGNHRLAAIVENNQGFLLLGLGRLDGVEKHLLRARKFFDGVDDRVRRAQVDDTLARFHLARNELAMAEQSAERAVKTLEIGDEEALLAEALTTKGVVLCRLKRHSEARGILEGAHRVAERCGDGEGAGRALLIIIEEMGQQLETEERRETGRRLKRLLGASQQVLLRDRLENCLQIIATLNRGLVD